MSGQEILYLVLGLAIVAGIAFIVFRGGAFKGQRKSDGSFVVETAAPRTTEVAKHADLADVGNVHVSGEAVAKDGTPADKVTVGEGMKVRGGGDVTLTGVSRQDGAGKK